MARKPAKWDNAREKDVSREVEVALINANFVQPKAIARLPKVVRDAALEQSAGFFFKTQIAKLGKVDRATFAQMQQQSAGIPDFWVRKHYWPPKTWLGIELKARRSGVHISPEQELLADKDGIVICRSAVEVLAAIEELDCWFDARIE